MPDLQAPTEVTVCNPHENATALVTEPALALCDKVTGWKLPVEAPKALELTAQQYDELRELLASDLLPAQTCTQETLERCGYSCYLEYMMHRLSLVIERD
jgi:hypothetical protein